MATTPPIAIVTPHATLVRPSVGGSRPILPGSPMPHLLEDAPTERQAGAPAPIPVAASASGPAGTPERRSSLAPLTTSLHGLALRHYRSDPSSPSHTSTFSSPPPYVVQKKYKIYYCPEMAHLAHQIVKLDERFVLGEIQWGHFPDGFPNLFIHGAEHVKNYHIAFLANFHSPAVFFEQFSVITSLPKLLPKSFKLFLPFFPTGTMERVTRLGEVATANSLARILSTIPNGSKGPAQICIFDIHALQNQFYFKDTVLIRLGTCVNLLLDRIAELPDKDNINIAFPDDGAAKRFGDMFTAYPNVIICHKVRDGDKRVVKMKEGDTVGKHVIIVDDLVQSGGTLQECAKELLRNGAACVSAYVTHAIFPNASYEKFIIHTEQEAAMAGTADVVASPPVRPPPHQTRDDASVISPPIASVAYGASLQYTHSPVVSNRRGASIFKYFWVTDSNPNVAERLRGRAPFEVLSCAENIRQVILDEDAENSGGGGRRC